MFRIRTFCGRNYHLCIFVSRCDVCSWKNICFWRNIFYPRHWLWREMLQSLSSEWTQRSHKSTKYKEFLRLEKKLDKRELRESHMTWEEIESTCVLTHYPAFWEMIKSHIFQSGLLDKICYLWASLIKEMAYMICNSCSGVDITYIYRYVSLTVSTFKFHFCFWNWLLFYIFLTIW